jgi:hypothetical protein
VADILRHTQQADHRSRGHQEIGLGRPVLLALALGFACIALAIPAQFAVIAVLPVLACIVAVLAAFRIMG